MEDKIIDNKKSDEFMAMFSNDENSKSQDSHNLDEKKDDKVLVKSGNVSYGTSKINDSGYGSVLGVILIIVAMSFILAALIIRVLI